MKQPTQKQPVSCPVCDGNAANELYLPSQAITDPATLYGAASGLRGTQRLVRCRDCGMIYENPRFPPEIIWQGYASSEEGGHDSQHHLRVRSFLWALKRLKAHLPPSGAKILDVGTAGGAFLEAAEKFGYDAWGLEPSQFLVEQGKKRGLKIEQGTIEEHPFAPASFDMVSLWDVIEHLPGPKAALVEIHHLLKPGGVLLVNYPDIGTWQAKLTGKRFWWILSVHLHHFTRATMRKVMRRSGFEPVHFRRYWQILEFGYLERMAIHYRIPLTNVITRLTPGFIQRIPIPYHASQTTAIARRTP